MNRHTFGDYAPHSLGKRSTYSEEFSQVEDVSKELNKLNLLNHLISQDGVEPDDKCLLIYEKILE